MHLHRNAVALGCTSAQIATLRRAAMLSMGNREQRVEAGRLIEPIRLDLKEALAAACYAAQARGEKVVDFNDDGAKRIKGRDGVVSMQDSGSLTEDRVVTAFAYRALFEEVGPSALGSQLSRIGEASGGRSSTDAMVRHGLHRAYAGLRLTAAEQAVGCPDGVAVLRAVAGEGRTIGSLASSGGARRVLIDRLVKALDAVRVSLAETGGLRIRGS